MWGGILFGCKMYAIELGLLGWSDKRPYPVILRCERSMGDNVNKPVLALKIKVAFHQVDISMQYCSSSWQLF